MRSSLQFQGQSGDEEKSSVCNLEDSKQESEAPPEGRGSSLLYASNHPAEGVTILSPYVCQQQGWNLEGDLAAICAIR